MKTFGLAVFVLVACPIVLLALRQGNEHAPSDSEEVSSNPRNLPNILIKDFVGHSRAWSEPSNGSNSFGADALVA